MSSDLDLILGPILLAVVANAILFGICVVQWYQYFTSRYDDPMVTRLLVSWVMLIDIFQMASTTYMLWQFTVPNFGNPLIFTNVPWPYPTTPIFIAFASVPIQHFLAYRIKGLSHSWIPFVIISMLSLGQGACGIAGGILATVVSDPADFSSLIPVADAWISLAVFTDVLITVLLFWYLHKSKTGFARMDNVLERLIRIAVETAAIGAAFCIVDVIIFNTNGKTNLHYFFALLQGRIYTNTLMVTLNSRAGLREQMSANPIQELGSQFLGANTTIRFKPTEVSIAVHQDIQLDSMSPHSPAHSNCTDKYSAKDFYPV